MRRLARHGAGAAGLVLGSLLLGMAEGLAWRDGFLNAAMLLGGMGPIDPPHTDGGKLFEGFYALYAGLVFLIAASLLLAPAFHRLIHKFHWDRDRK
jgi:hypothetical protein